MEDINSKCYVTNNKEKLFSRKTIRGYFVFIDEENKSKEFQGNNVLSFTKFVLGSFVRGFFGLGGGLSGVMSGGLSCHLPHYHIYWNRIYNNKCFRDFPVLIFPSRTIQYLQILNQHLIRQCSTIPCTQRAIFTYIQNQVDTLWHLSQNGTVSLHTSKLLDSHVPHPPPPLRFHFAKIRGLGNASGTILRSTGHALKDTSEGAGSLFHSILGGLGGSLSLS